MKYKILNHDTSYGMNMWYVEGPTWNGNVSQYKNGAYKCDCIQFKYHKSCTHIQTVEGLIYKAKVAGYVH